MSVDLVSLGRHNLDVSTVENASRQISERLDINIAIGEWKYGKFFPQQVFERHPGLPFYQMWDISDEDQPVHYNLDCPEEYIDSREGGFCFMIISLESVYISLWEVPWRWQRYWNFFGDDGLESCLEDIQAFRKVAKEYYGKLGASYIYCYADQGPSELIGNYEDSTWEEFENAIRTGKYLDDNKEYLEKEWSGFNSKDLVIFNVSYFLSGKTTRRSHSWWDVFYDDFADLD